MRKSFMFGVTRTVILALGCGLLLSACGGDKSGSAAHSGGAANAERVLNLYIWSDYLAPKTLSKFEKQTGIKVNAAYYDTNETLDAKLLAGSSGYDIVIPPTRYFERQVNGCRCRPRDKPSRRSLQPTHPWPMAKVACQGPGPAL